MTNAVGNSALAVRVIGNFTYIEGIVFSAMRTIEVGLSARNRPST